jgi:uncharacterized membrane protein (UPF0127 family)
MKEPKREQKRTVRKKIKKKRKIIQRNSSKGTVPGKRKKPILLAVFVVLTSGVILYALFPDTQMRKYSGSFGKEYKVSFHKEGELVFIDSSTQGIKKEIDIEIADSDYERTKGLMHRRSMKENQGMLFVYEKAALQRIWMKNTYISLDILFVNEKFEIVTIYKKATPLSGKIMPSFKDAMYVVEVVAGFCDVYNIKEGDRIRFEYSEG